MNRVMPRHSGSTVLDFLAKRGESSSAFFFPFLNQQMSLLDIGCGPGAVTAVLAGRVKRAIGIDIERNAIERACRIAEESGNNSPEFIAADMTSLPFGDNAFDAVFAHGVLYHLDAATLTKTLGEGRRVLRPGGVIGIRDSDTGGDILHPESEGLLRTLDLWMKWYGHADSDSVRFGRRQSACSGPTDLRRFGAVQATSIIARMPPRAAKPSPTPSKASKTSGVDLSTKA
jgi:ubiquinone/menaquinone biosynthesis C-methylase UbiE